MALKSVWIQKEGLWTTYSLKDCGEPYLESYSSILDNRKSIIYKKRPRFSVFGIGDYSFTSWKVAISGLYKNIHFSSIGQNDNKPIMVDDTCYFIPCSSENEARFIAEELNSKPCLKFLKSLIFFDAKRPINIDILSRVDLKKLSEINGKLDEALKYLSYTQVPFSKQLAMVFEKQKEYRTKRSTLYVSHKEVGQLPIEDR
jgi:hypothetical protein